MRSLALEGSWAFSSRSPLADAGPAQAYPEKPIKLVVTWPPGGSADAIGRLVARRVDHRAGPDRLRRERRRRLRQHRHAAVRPLAARRLHAAAGHEHDQRREPGAVHEARLPSDRRLRADLAGRAVAEHPHRVGQLALQVAEGHRRGGQGQARQADLRIRRQRQLRAPERRAVQVGREDRRAARSRTRATRPRWSISSAARSTSCSTTVPSRTSRAERCVGWQSPPSSASPPCPTFRRSRSSAGPACS